MEEYCKDYACERGGRDPVVWATLVKGIIGFCSRIMWWIKKGRRVEHTMSLHLVLSIRDLETCCVQPSNKNYLVHSSEGWIPTISHTFRIFQCRALYLGQC